MEQLEHVSSPGSYREWTCGTPNQDWEKLLVNTCHFLVSWGWNVTVTAFLLVLSFRMLWQLARRRNGTTSRQNLLALGQLDMASQGTFQCFAKLSSHATTWLPLAALSPPWNIDSVVSGSPGSLQGFVTPRGTLCSIVLRNVTLEICPSFYISSCS